MNCWNFEHVWAAHLSHDKPDDAHTHLPSCRACTATARADAAALEVRNMKRSRWRLGKVVNLTAILFLAAATSSSAAVPTNGLVASYNFNGNASDSSGNGHHGTIHNATLTSNRLGDGSSAYSFNGSNAYIEIPDHNDFSVSTSGSLSISVWMRPGTLKFPNTEGSGYVHWMGKGVKNQHEWTFRMYSSNNTEGRDNRTSFYLFNLMGGLGAGSYVQEPVIPGTWYHYVAMVDISTDKIKLYKNGVLRDEDAFIKSKYHINPRNGTALLRIGTRDFASYFKGAIDNINIYNRVLSDSEILQLYHDTTR